MVMMILLVEPTAIVTVSTFELFYRRNNLAFDM